MENGNGHGGKREGAGRKPKTEEIQLIERLKPLDDIAFEKLSELVRGGDMAALKLFMAYRFGQPRQTIDANVTGELNIEWHEIRNYETK